MWINAEITPSKNMDKFNEVFAEVVDEENDFEKANYNEEWLNDLQLVYYWWWK